MLDVFVEQCPDLSCIRRVISTLIPKMTHLAGHFIGQHILKKLYESSITEDKEKIANALVSARGNLARSKEGRNSMHLVRVDLYEKDIKEWRRALERQERATALFEELDPTSRKGRSHSVARSVTSSIEKKLEEENVVGQKSLQVHNDKDGEVGGDIGKRKRKRKRGGAKEKATKIRF